MDYDDDEEDVPTVQSNGNEEASIIVGAVNNDSVWLDREEDEMIQNVKRKKSVPSTESRENEPEVLKRRKTEVPSNEERLPAPGQEKPQQDIKLCTTVEEVNHSDHAGVNKLNDADGIRPVTNGPGCIKAHEVAGS